MALLALAPSALAAQLRTTGWQETALGGLAVASRPAAALAGGGASWRDRGRSRVGFMTLAGGTDDGRFAARGELTYHFLLDPGRRSGWGLYGGGGLAFGIAESERGQGWLQAVVGVDARPGAAHGWYLEGGFGGGARLGAGYRWRKQNAPGE